MHARYASPAPGALLPKGVMVQQPASARLASWARCQRLSGVATVLPAGANVGGPGYKSHLTHQLPLHRD